MSLSQVQSELRLRLKPVQRQEDGSFLSSITFRQNFCGFDGHFPEKPIVPAVCLLSAAELLASESVGCQLRLDEIVNMKFKKHLVPDDTVTFAFSLIENIGQEHTFSFTISTPDGTLIAKMRLILTT